MKLVFATLAQQELEEARRFYNRQQSGLGTAFLRETQKAAAHILQRPLAWPVEVDPVRRFHFRPLSLQNAVHRPGRPDYRGRYRPPAP